MKIPYIKIPITDMYAYLAPCSPEIKGKIFEAVLSFGMYRAWPHLALEGAQEQAYTIVKQLIEREIKSYQKFCKEQKQKAKKLWDKKQNHVEAVAMPLRQCQSKQEQEAKQKQELELENINTPIPPTSQGEQVSSFSQKELEKTRLWAFANEVIKHYEASVQTEEQKAIWFHKNRRQLRDIFEFCGKDTTLALRTILKCIERLKESGLSGGYAAVCRNLPDYYTQAKQELEEEYGYTK